MSKKKICHIKYEPFVWSLVVDDQEIGFIGEDGADYFEQHYRSLGYKIVRDRVPDHNIGG